MQFPRFVYRCPGMYQRTGGTYSYQSVDAGDEHAKALADGWFATLPEAMEAHDKPPVKAEEKPADVPAENAPVTRAELEQKAKELGLKFDGRTTDKKLAALIAVEA